MAKHMYMLCALLTSSLACASNLDYTALNIKIRGSEHLKKLHKNNKKRGRLKKIARKVALYKTDEKKLQNIENGRTKSRARRGKE